MSNLCGQTVDSIVWSCLDVGMAGIAINDKCGWWRHRSSQRDFEAFVRYVDMLADAMHKQNLELFATHVIPYEMGMPEAELKGLLH